MRSPLFFHAHSMTDADEIPFGQNPTLLVDMPRRGAYILHQPGTIGCVAYHDTPIPRHDNVSSPDHGLA